MIKGLGAGLLSVLKGLGVFIGGAALAASIYVGALAPPAAEPPEVYCPLSRPLPAGTRG